MLGNAVNKWVATVEWQLDHGIVYQFPVKLETPTSIILDWERGEAPMTDLLGVPDDLSIPRRVPKRQLVSELDECDINDQIFALIEASDVELFYAQMEADTGT